ncbi:MAG TPA: hypothetical protein PK239_00760 [Chitinophagales bacterium]|nr:hypothetical protein [Chitinophagales bacterium]HRK25793.1 hypothetical protein [Chitinophagales bacterium]
MTHIFLLYFFFSNNSAAQPHLAVWDTAVHLHRQAAEKAITYLAAPDSDMDWTISSVYSYLQRLYNLPPIQNPNHFLHKIDNSDDLLRTTGFRTLLQPDSPPNEADLLHYQPNTLEYSMVQALGCKNMHPGERYLQEISLLADFGSYELTHAYLILQWLKEQQCACVQLPYFTIVEQKILQQLLSFLHSPQNNWSDVYIEALALLCYSHGSYYIKPEWLQPILALQQNNGGWLPVAGYEATSAHTTVLSLWVLLAYTSPPLNPQNWVMVK